MNVLDYILAAAAEPAVPGLGWDLNDIVGGGAGATLVGLGYFVIKLILDRTIPSRSDARANVTLLLDGLNNMVAVLREERAADAQRLVEKQARIDFLEKEADADFARLSDLREEIAEINKRLARKERSIATLVFELRRLGATVQGIDLEDDTLVVSNSPAEIQIAKKRDVDSK
jgi:hypothetical protein